MDRVDQRLIIEGFGEDLERPGLHEPDREGDVCMSGHENRGNLIPSIVQRRLEIEPAGVGHPDVQNQAARDFGADGRKAGGWIRKGA